MGMYHKNHLVGPGFKRMAKRQTSKGMRRAAKKSCQEFLEDSITLTRKSHNLHGTGCTLSSAIATYLAKGYPMRESIQHAKTYITQAIIAGKELNVGHGNGPLWHFPDSVAQMCTFCAVVS